MKISFDVRRVWKCPECGFQAKLPGNRVAGRCPHCSDAVWMKLVEKQRKERVYSVPHATDIEIDDLDDEEQATASPPEVESAEPSEVVEETVVPHDVAVPEATANATEDSTLTSETAVDPPAADAPSNAPAKKRKKRNRRRRRRNSLSDEGSSPTASETTEAPADAGSVSPPKKSPDEKSQPPDEEGFGAGVF